MLLLRMWNYFRGYVIIIVEGFFLEKFLNICMRRQIYLWDIERAREYRMQMKVSLKGFKAMRSVPRKTNCRVRIKEKRGVPFIIHRYKRRKAFLLGIVLFITIFYFLSSFIWSVEVSGNKSISSDIILENLSSLGIRPGVWRYGIQPHDIVNKMLVSMNDIAWIGIEAVGTKVKVEIVERVKAPAVIDKSVPCNIIASRDGLIKGLVVKAGQPAVKEGDTVKKGQLLISGIVNSRLQNQPIMNVHAMGTAMARTWYENTKPVVLVVQERNRTGKEYNRHTVHLFQWKWEVMHKQPPFENYDNITMIKKLSINDAFELPFFVSTEKFYEVEIKDKSIHPEEAGKMAMQEAYRGIADNLAEGAVIVSKDERIIKLEDGSLAANVILECLEDIGIQVPIDG